MPNVNKYSKLDLSMLLIIFHLLNDVKLIKVTVLFRLCVNIHKCSEKLKWLPC